MLDSVIERTKMGYYSLKEEISRMNQGYQFGRYLADDIRQRTKLVANGTSDHLNEIAILLQLVEYHFALEDVRMQDGNPYSMGVALYGITHRKDDEMITDLWNRLNGDSSKME